MVYRIYVEKKPGFDVEAQGLKNELVSLLGIQSLSGLRLLNRYDVEGIDEVQEETEAAHGDLPLAGLNLFNRARIRIRGERLGLESVTLSGGRITFLGVDVPKKVAFELKTRYGAVNFPKSRKLSVPYKAGAGAGSGLGRGLDANDGTGPVAAALMLLQQLGASDDD